MSDDGRLDLDDGGRPIGASSAADVVEGTRGSRSDAGRALDALLLGGTRWPANAARVVTAALVLLVGGGLVVYARSAPAAVVPTVQPVSFRSLPAADGSGAPRVLASYAVRTGAGNAPVLLVGVRGEGIAGTEVLGSDGGAGVQSLVVDPDCAHVLDAAADPSYRLLLSTPDPAGPDRAAVVSVEGGAALASAVRRECWSWTASRALSAGSVHARPGRGPWTSLDVTLHNTGGLPMSVTAVDVADVDTLSMADSAVVVARGTAVVRVRLPIARCSDATSGGAPVALTWSVGAPGAPPSAFATTSLTPVQREAITSAERGRCGTPPRVAVEVVSARSAREPDSIDPRGLSVTLRVHVLSHTDGAVTVGDPAAALTADARPQFSGIVVQPGRTVRVADVVWHTRCGPMATPDRVPVTTTVDGLTYAWSVPLTGTSLSAVRAAACA